MNGVLMCARAITIQMRNGTVRCNKAEQWSIAILYNIIRMHHAMETDRLAEHKTEKNDEEQRPLP